MGNPYAPTVLLQGETGTGKGLVARVIHDSGPRAPGPFIDVNCAAIPETLLEAELFGFEAGAFTDAKRAKPGLFEAASGGTLFLDEIEALPPRAAEQAPHRHRGEARAAPGGGGGARRRRQADRRHPDGSARALAEGRFRADLYHRLAVVVLELAPHCARAATDILALARHFLRQYGEVHRLSPKRLSRAAEAWLAGLRLAGQCARAEPSDGAGDAAQPRDASVAPERLERLCLPATGHRLRQRRPRPPRARPTAGRADTHPAGPRPDRRATSCGRHACWG